VGTPCLSHEAPGDYTVPAMALFAFLSQPQLPVRNTQRHKPFTLQYYVYRPIARYIAFKIW
jgi:hypothetical protein